MLNKPKILTTGILLLLALFSTLQLQAQAPTGLSAGPSDSQVTLWWDNFGAGWSYEIYWQTTPGVSLSSNKITVVANTWGYVHTGLNASTTYYYAIRAAMGGNYSTLSSEINTTPISQTNVYTAGGNGDGHVMGTCCLLNLNGGVVPLSIANLNVSAFVLSNVLWWDYLTTATAYTVEYNNGGGWTLAGTTTTLSYIHSGLTAGLSYNYRVTPILSGGCSTAASGTVSAIPAPDAPIAGGGNGDGHVMASGCLLNLNGNNVAIPVLNPNVAASLLSNVIWWDYVTTATTYTVEFSTATPASWSQAATTTALSYIHSNLTAGTNYTYRITPILSGCLAAASSTVAAIPAPDALVSGGGAGDGHVMSSGCLIDLNGNNQAPAPTGVGVYVGITSNVLIWDTYTGATSYTIEFSTATPASWSQAATTTALSYIHTNLTAGTTYSYRVTPSVSGGCPAGASSAVSAIPAPDALISGGGNGDGHVMATGCLLDLNGNNVAIPVLNPNVAASLLSNVIWWDYVTTATAYTVEFSTATPASWSQAATTTALSYIHTGLTAGKTYSYRITPVLSGCTAVASSTISAIPAPDALVAGGGNGDGHVMASGCLFTLNGDSVPLTVANLSVAASVLQNVIWWDYLTTASSYTVEYNAGGSWAQASTTTTLSYIHTGLSSGTIYYYRVTPVLSGGCSAAASSTVSARPAPQATVPGGSNGDGHAMTSSCNITILLTGIDPVVSPPGPISSCGSVNISLIESPTEQDYQWYLNGGSISGATTTTYTATTAGSYTMQIHTPTNNCWAQSMPVVIYGNPLTPANISGPNMICAGLSGQIYSVPPISGATSYVWVYSGTGANISGNTNPVTINYASNATGGNLTVYGVNSCGNGPTSSAFNISLSSLPDPAGSITGPASTCMGQSGVNYSVAAIPGATNYIWSYSGTGAPINGMGNNVTIDFASNATPGTLSVYGAAMCGNGTSASLGISLSSNFTITATAGSNGSISPLGVTTVSCGGSQSYSISANPNYFIVDVLVDGVSIGAVTSYTFTNVLANHTITVTFSQSTYTINASAGVNGSISPSGAVLVISGTNQTFDFSPNTCYQVAGVIVDGSSVGTPSSYTFSNVLAGHTILVNFSAIPASIVCPSNIITNTDVGSCQATNVSIGTPDISGNCTGSSTVNNHPSTIFPKGTTTVTWTVTTPAGATATCQQTVTVNDTQNPAITCPSNITFSNTTEMCGAVVTYATPVGTDHCPGATTAQTAGLASGSTFPLGITTNTFKVTDAAGKTAICSFKVTVNDTQNPSITCPLNIVVNNTPVMCGAVVTYNAIVGTDNCSGSSTVQTTGLANGATFPLGITTNTFKVTDAAGNTAKCSFTITVSDNQNPAISCPSNINVNCAPGTCSAVVPYTAPVGTDNCPGVSTVLTLGLASGVTYPVGVTTNTFKVTDAVGNVGTCSFTVIVTDNQNPAITCPTNITLNNTPGTCGTLVTYTTPVITDNCPGATTVQTAGLASGANFPVGITTNTFRVTDAESNTATCSFTITITDNQNPAITCPTNISINNTPGICGAVVTYITPVGTDNCPGATTVQTVGLVNGATFPVGITTNTFRVTDASGKVASCSFTITIADNQNPAITCPSNISVSNALGTCNALVTYTAPVGTDNCTGASTTQIAGLASGATFPVGITTNTFKVTDVSGYTSKCSFTVTVTDNQNPAITCFSNISVNSASGTCGAVVTYTAITGTDNCPGISTVQTAGLASGATFPVGVTTNIFRVTDAAGNVASCSFIITITDNQNPVITCPSNINMNSITGTCGAIITYTPPGGTDNCSGSGTFQIAGSASGATFPVGITTNTFKVTDAAGNTTLCSFTVTVTDNQNPAISCPSNITVNNTPGACGALVTFIAPVGTDNCTGVGTVQTAGLASGVTFPVGIKTNIFKVIDVAGNSATCSFTVTVTDNQNPVISCPSNISVNNTPGFCGVVVTFTAPIGTDNCPGTTSIQTAGLASGATFPVGTTINIFKVTDAAGNTATCGSTVTITDNQNPAITCSSNITVNNNPGACGAVVTFIAPVGTDNCPGSSTIQTAGLTSGATFPVGIITNTIKVTDAVGNTATCSFTVKVTDNQNPTITCPSGITVNNDPGTCTCTAIVTFLAPVGTDNCPGSGTVQTAGFGSGATLPIGTTTNLFIVTDAAGNTATCSFTITVTDNQNPAIICPSNISVNIAPSTCSAVITYTAPVGTDNCPGSSTTQTAGLASGATFPGGITTNTFMVTDAAGNIKSCSFTVMIMDNQNPVITCPSNIIVSNTSGICGAVVNYTTPIGTDNCSGSTTIRTTGIASGAIFPVGITTNSFTVTDAAGNTAICSFIVTVNDIRKPQINCPSNIVVSNTSGTCNAVVTYNTPIGTDNCPGSITTRTTGLASGAIFPLGTTMNTFKVTDAVGNFKTCSFTVTVKDNQNPAISCPSNITVNNIPGNCGVVVTFTSPHGTDNCSGSITVPVTGLASGATFPVGITTNTFKVTDAAGNTAFCSFSVTVTNSSQLLSCPNDINVSNDIGACGTLITFVNPVGTGNCPGTTIIQTAGLVSGSLFPVGITTNTFKITDADGNTAFCSFTLTVNDKEDPIIVCPPTINVNADPGECTVSGLSLGTLSSSDNCSLASMTNNSPAQFPVGSTTVTWIAADAAGNFSMCNQIVKVTDNQSPFITCSSDVIVNVSNGSCSASGVNLDTPVTTDNCMVASVVNDSPSIFPPGITTVKWTVADGVGNTAVCYQTVTAVLQFRTLNLKAFLEGFYIGSGTMKTAMDFDANMNYFPKWGTTITDTFSLELHDTTIYTTVHYIAFDISLHTDGTASAFIPAGFDDAYYITVRQHNHLSVTSSAPVNFNTCIINYDFTSNASNTFGNNVKSIGSDFVIYAGDITSAGHDYPGVPLQEGTIDLQDVYYIFNSYLNGDYAYNISDISGDGVVDLVDVFMSFDNYLLGIYAKTP